MSDSRNNKCKTCSPWHVQGQKEDLTTWRMMWEVTGEKYREGDMASNYLELRDVCYFNSLESYCFKAGK